MKEQKTMEGLTARRIALKVIRKVTEDGAYAALALDGELKGCGLGNADRRLVSRLTYDTLDHLIYLDWALGQVMAKPDTDIKLINILRLGACQILLEDRIPESAATNLCVQLCAELGMPGLKGVCNGILRNLIRKKEELKLPDPETEPAKAASIRYSVPEWIWKRLKEDYGEEADKILSYRNNDEGWMLRPNLTRLDDAGFEQLLNRKVWKKDKSEIPHAWKITGAMDISRDADYLAGNYSIQSGGSMLACMAVGVKRGQQVLDCCAAPGGKTCYLAEMMGGTGRIQAWDVHEHRVSLIEAQAKRLGLENIRPMVRENKITGKRTYRKQSPTWSASARRNGVAGGDLVSAVHAASHRRADPANPRALLDLQRRLPQHVRRARKDDRREGRGVRHAVERHAVRREGRDRLHREHHRRGD